jgi:hypothetical protein
MHRLVYIALILCFNYSILNATQTVDLEEQQTVCTDETKCEQVDSIFIPNKLEKCSDDLFFQYGADSFAFLTPDGLVNSKTKDTECDSSFKRLKYALKNVIIEVIKHKNSVYVKKFTTSNENDTEKHLSGISQFMHEKVHDFVQYILVFLLIITKISGYIFRPFSKYLSRRYVN